MVQSAGYCRWARSRKVPDMASWKEQYAEMSAAQLDKAYSELREEYERSGEARLPSEERAKVYEEWCWVEDLIDDQGGDEDEEY